jgi:hypothetical protein
MYQIPHLLTSEVSLLHPSIFNSHFSLNSTQLSILANTYQTSIPSPQLSWHCRITGAVALEMLDTVMYLLLGTCSCAAIDGDDAGTSAGGGKPKQRLKGG